MPWLFQIQLQSSAIFVQIIQNTLLMIFQKSVKYSLNIFYFNNKMKTILLVGLMFSLSLQQSYLFPWVFQNLTVLINSSTSNPTIISSGQVQKLHSFKKDKQYLVEDQNQTNSPDQPNYPNKPSKSPRPNKPDEMDKPIPMHKYIIDFNVSCEGAVILKISNHRFLKVVFNNRYLTISNILDNENIFDLSPLKCGSNNLEFHLDKRDNGPAPNLTFSVRQDQLSCFNCQSQHSSFNRSTCECDCNPKQGLRCQQNSKNYLWRGYPVCDCVCGITKCGENELFIKETCQCKKKAFKTVNCLFKNKYFSQCIKARPQRPNIKT